MEIGGIIFILEKRDLIGVNIIEEGLRRNLIEFSGRVKSKRRLCFGWKE